MIILLSLIVSYILMWLIDRWDLKNYNEAIIAIEECVEVDVKKEEVIDLIMQLYKLTDNKRKYNTLMKLVRKAEAKYQIDIEEWI